MDLGRPIARHDIRRPHEVIDLDREVTVDDDVTSQGQLVADDQPLSSETPER
jgi:hypothetical protein